MMNEPLDEKYLTWLYSKMCEVAEVRPEHSYWGLFRQLFTKEFVWIVANDDNRVEDGRDLRYRFLEEYRIDHVDANWMGLGCSMLELLMGLATRMEFEIDGRADEWFWKLLKNVRLDKYNDTHRFPSKKIDEVMDTIIWRTYNPSGRGGLFPLREPREDQRDVELWYQLSAYILAGV